MSQFQEFPQLASYRSSGEGSMSEEDEEDEEDWGDDVDGEGETEEDS